MIQPSVTLSFSETKNEFQYVYLDPIKPTFKPIVADIGITEAIRFVEAIRAHIDHPMTLVEVAEYYRTWIK